MRSLSRRRFLKLAAAGGTGAVLSACAQPTPQVVEKIVEKPVIQTQVVEKTTVQTQVVEKAVVQTQVVEKVVTAAPKAGWQGTIELWGQSYQPDVPRGAGMEPLHEFRKLADEWQSMHPGVTIKFIEGPGQTTNTDQISAWMKANQATGTMPDMTWTQDNYLNRDIGTNYWVSIDPFINTPNPYIPAGTQGHDKWSDAFIAGFDARNKAIDGRYYGAPLSYSAVNVFANVDLLKQAGLDVQKDIIDPRWTFDSMLDVSDKIKKAGITPWAQGWQASFCWWLQTSTFTGLFKSTGTWDKLDTDHDDFVTSLEHFQAIAAGIETADMPEMRANYQMNKDWCPYWADGWQGGQVDARTLYMTGQAAFWWGGTFDFMTVKSDPERKFEFKVVRFPDCAPRMAKLGSGGGKTTYPGGAADQMAITNTAAKKGNVDLCVDWMKYFLSCDGQTRMATEMGSIPPVIRCAKGNPELDQFAPAPGETLLKTVHMLSMNASYGADYLRIIGEYLAGTSTLEQAIPAFQKSMDTWAKDALERAAKPS